MPRIHIATFCALCSALIGSAAEPADTIQETRLEGLISPYGLTHITISPDGKRVAYISKAGGKCFAVVDGHKGREYDSCQRVVFSPNSKRVAYVATSGGRAFVVADGVKGKEYLTAGQPVFSPDSRMVAYNASPEPGKRLVVANGVESKPYDFDKRGSVRLQPGNFYFPFHFSPDGKRVAYVAKRDGKYFVVVDGKEGRKHDLTEKVVFSPDGKRVAYVAMRGPYHPGTWGAMEDMVRGHWSVFIDGEQGKEYALIRSAPVFSPDSKRIAYVAIYERPSGPGSNPRGLVVVDGAEGRKGYNAVNTPIFSADSKRVIYTATRDKRGLLVVDGQECESFEMFISADLKKLTYRAQLGGEWATIRCGPTGSPPVRSSMVWNYPRLSPDGKRMARIATRDGKSRVVVDGKEGKGYGSILHGTLMFSRDGKRACYVASHTGRAESYRRAFVVMDGAEGTEYDYIHYPQFSPDGKHSVYEAWRDGKRFLVVDGKEEELKGKVCSLQISSDSRRIGYIRTDLRGEDCLLVVGDTTSKKYDRLVRRLDVPGMVAGVVKRGGELFVVIGKLD
jgi:Tol biopolymer transport system component